MSNFLIFFFHRFKYECKMCDRKFLNVSQFREHVYVHENKGRKGEHLC
jgi:hypothetical protein